MTFTAQSIDLARCSMFGNETRYYKQGVRTENLCSVFYNTQLLSVTKKADKFYFSNIFFAF